MGNLEKTQRPLPITPLQEGKSTVRKRGPPSQGGSPGAWVPVCSHEHPTLRARGLPR